MKASTFAERQTGVAQDPVGWISAKEQQKKRDERSSALATLLEAAGRSTILSELTAVGLVTNAFESICRYRHSGIIPSDVARRRAPMVTALSYHIDKLDPSREHFGALVIHGPSCEVGQLGPAIIDLNRAVSKCAAAARSKFGIDVLMRATELPLRTTPEGTLYSVHAHIVLKYPARMPQEGKGSKAAFSAWIGKRFGILAPSIEIPETTPKALVSYVLKPPFEKGELPRSPDEAAALEDAVKGLHLVQAMGSFRDFWSQLRKAGLQVRWDHELGYVEVEIQTRGGARSHTTEASASDQRANVVLTVTAPNRRLTHIAEPTAFIRNFDLESFDPNTALARLGFDARAAWYAKGAPTPAELLRIIEEARKLWEAETRRERQRRSKEAGKTGPSARHGERPDAASGPADKADPKCAIERRPEAAEQLQTPAGSVERLGSHPWTNCPEIPRTERTSGTAAIARRDLQPPCGSRSPNRRPDGTAASSGQLGQERRSKPPLRLEEHAPEPRLLNPRTGSCPLGSSARASAASDGLPASQAVPGC